MFPIITINLPNQKTTSWLLCIVSVQIPVRISCIFQRICNSDLMRASRWDLSMTNLDISIINLAMSINIVPHHVYCYSSPSSLTNVYISFLLLAASLLVSFPVCLCLSFYSLSFLSPLSQHNTTQHYTKSHKELLAPVWNVLGTSKK